MSNTTTRPPCVSDERIENYADEWNKGERGITIAHRTSLVQGADWCREIYEAKWGPLIQQLVDALIDEVGRQRPPFPKGRKALYDAAASGFQSSQS